MAREETIKAEIRIPKGFKLLKVGEKVRETDYFLADQEIHEPKMEWRILKGKQGNVQLNESIIRELEW